MNSKKYTTLFLDRDGVINHKIDGYVQCFSEFHFMEGALKSISLLTKYFDRIIIVTNQQGIGKKLMKEQDLLLLHSQMILEIERNGGKVNKIYFCPHLSTSNCSCRKPKPGMLLKSKEDFPEIEFDKSYLIGDSDSDIQAAFSVEIKSFKVSKEYTLSDWTNEFLLD